MTGFNQNQLKNLKGKLAARHVRTRQSDGFELSYIEGWFAIAEANRIFGFDGWDRETVDFTCLWQGRVQGKASCSCSARLRITFQAGTRRVIREGSGFGSGNGANPEEAHEKALKEAETDAMKRALVTFGNRFGLALYDRAQRGVTKVRGKDSDPPWPVILPGQSTPTLCATPHEVYAELRKHLESLTTTSRVQELWQRNETTLKIIRERHRELVDRAGTHYTAVFANLCRDRAKRLSEDDAPPVSSHR
jgi:DNA recombination protein Rad52